jgi:hypothetical protein
MEKKIAKQNSQCKICFKSPLALLACPSLRYSALTISPYIALDNEPPKSEGTFVAFPCTKHLRGKEIEETHGLGDDIRRRGRVTDWQRSRATEELTG